MSSRSDIAIVGPGAVGTALGVLARRAGWRVVAIGGRSADHAAAAAETVGADVRACDAAEAAASAGLVLLTVGDDAIADLCDELAGAEALRRGAVVAHCSGAMTSDVLAPARERCGCAVGSLHPLQTFPTVQSAVERMGEATCFIEGDERAVAVLAALAGDVAARAARIDPAGKALYHAAAVTACNYLATLIDAAGRLAEGAGIDATTFVSAAGAMIRATVENVLTMGPAHALTGPIARGDSETVARHVRAIDDATLSELYRSAGMATVELALRKGSIGERQADAIRTALNAESRRSE